MRTRGALVSMCALGCLVSMGTPAQAQGDLDPETKKRFLGYLRGANAFYEEGRHEKALELYAEAYKLVPSPALAYRMALSSEKAGKLREAIKFYDVVLQNPPNAKIEVAVKEKLPALKDKVPPVVKLTSKPSGANIFLNSPTSAPIGSTPYEGELKPGTYRIIFKLDGYVPSTKEITLAPADEKSVDVELKGETSVAEIPEGETKGKGGVPWSAVGWTTTGLGAGLLVTGGVFSFLQMGAVNEVNSFDKRANTNPTRGRAQLEDLKAQANSHHGTALALYIAGGVVTAAGAVLLLTTGSSGETETGWNFDFRVSPDSGWVGVQGAF